MEFIEFVAKEFFNTEQDLKIYLSDNLISIKTDSWHYQEAFFDQRAEFIDDDLIKLLNIVRVITTENTLTKIIDIKLDFLRIYYLITHEKYYIGNPSLDTHGRISSLSLREEFKTILSVPICDVIRQIAYHHIRIEWKQDKKLILTCDYDIMNIWDIYGKMDLFKLLFRKGIRFEIGKLMYYLYSFFFSRIASSANGYLNTKMFDSKLDCERIAFLISKSDDREKDCNAIYTDKPVIDFIQSIKEKKIELGLHTNYNTMKNPQSIHSQLVAFKDKITHVDPLSNRHHYLRYQFPTYLSTFEGTTIKRDFSIYFAESLLFRCGISSKFRVWNELTQSPFQTTLIPTTLMDVTFNDYLSLDEEAAFEKAKEKLMLSYSFGSDIVLLWHNGNTFKNSTNYSYHLSLYNKIIQFLESLDFSIENKK